MSSAMERGSSGSSPGIGSATGPLAPHSKMAPARPMARFVQSFTPGKLAMASFVTHLSVVRRHLSVPSSFLPWTTPPLGFDNERPCRWGLERGVDPAGVLFGVDLLRDVDVVQVGTRPVRRQDGVEIVLCHVSVAKPDTVCDTAVGIVKRLRHLPEDGRVQGAGVMGGLTQRDDWLRRITQMVGDPPDRSDVSWVRVQGVCPHQRCRTACLRVRNLGLRGERGEGW